MRDKTRIKLTFKGGLISDSREGRIAANSVHKCDPSKLRDDYGRRRRKLMVESRFGLKFHGGVKRF